MNKGEICNDLTEFCMHSGIIWIRDLIVLGDTARCLRGLINETDKISVAITDRNIKELLIDCDDVCRVKIDGKLVFKSKHYSSIEITDMTSKYARVPQHSKVDNFNCQRFDVIHNCDLPFPYLNYQNMRGPLVDNPAKYKKMVLGWINKNKSRHTIDAERIDSLLSVLRGNIPEGVREWMVDHADKLIEISDFSGLSFGIELHEREEALFIHCPLTDYNSNDDWYIYEDFKDQSLIGMLGWLYDNCEFVPIRIVHETFHDRGESHKWSHIKDNELLMESLGSFLAGLEYPPKDDVYYYIKINRNADEYLKRDNIKSPRQHTESRN